MPVKILFASALNRFSEVENRYPPLWPAYLSANAEENIGKGIFEFRYITQNIHSELRSFRPDILAISSVTQNYNYAIQYASVAKKFGVSVIIGGMHITSMPQCLTPDMDVGCIGEGDITFVELLRHYLDYGGFKSEYLDGIDGIVYHDGERFVKTKDRKVIEPLDKLPHPRRSVIGYGNRAYVYSARGCPYKCVFCACSRYWGEVRYSSPEYVIEEIRELVDSGVSIIRFADDNFSANKKRLKKIAELIIAKGFHRKIKFSCWSRANNLTPEVVRILKSMNIVSVIMGLESGCQRTLDYLKGNVTVEDNLRAINLLKDAGIQANADFIIGAPEETKQEIMQTYNFIKNSRLDFVEINIFSPLPGTPVWEYAKKRNLISDNLNWSKINFKFKRINQENFINLSKKLNYSELSTIFIRFQILRFRKNLKALTQTPWRREIPKVIVKMLLGKSIGFFQRRLG